MSGQHTSTMTVTVGQTFTINPVSLSGISSSNVLTGSATFPDTPGLAVTSTYHSVHIVGQNKPGWSNSLDGGYTTYSVTALQTGTYTITGSASRCKSYGHTQSGTYTSYYIKERESGSFTCTVTVVDVTSIYLPSTLSVGLGNQYAFSPVITDSRATTTLNWQSSNASVATIDNAGCMSAVGVGSTVITCSATNGVSAQCVVTVNPVLATGVSLNVTSAEMVPEETMQLTVMVSPENTTNPNVVWSTSNQDVATVSDNGLVVAKSSGQCEIKVTTTDGSQKTASCIIHVLENVLYIDDAVGVPSGTIVLPINLKNAAEITGLQFELELPEEVTIAKDVNGKLITTLSERATDQSISASILTNGNYQFIVFSGTSSPLIGNEGPIAYVTLNVSENMPVGEYTINIKEVELTKTDDTSLHHKDLTSTLILTEAMMGDINGDGRITVTDAVGIVNYILHRAPSVFISNAADVNGDGNITISDAVSVVNIVLNK